MNQTKAAPCIAGWSRSKMRCDYCGASGVEPCTGVPWNSPEPQDDAEFTAELRRRKAEHDAAAAEKVAGPRPTFRVTLEHVRGVEAAREVNEYSYTRYADAAAHFWGFVQLQPDDGWDFYGGGAGHLRANPYDLDRRGRDFTRNDAPWSAELKVIA